MTALEKKLDELERLANAAHNSVAGDYSHAWQNFDFATQPINLLALIQDIRSLIKSSPVAAVSGWRPIETAPKDGTWFLACATQPGWGATRIVRFAAPDDRLPIHGEGNIWPSPPTHWQPLPTPPEDK